MYDRLLVLVVVFLLFLLYFVYFPQCVANALTVASDIHAVHVLSGVIYAMSIYLMIATYHTSSCFSVLEILIFLCIRSFLSESSSFTFTSFYLSKYLVACITYMWNCLIDFFINSNRHSDREQLQLEFSIGFPRYLLHASMAIGKCFAAHYRRPIARPRPADSESVVEVDSSNSTGLIDQVKTSPMSPKIINADHADLCQSVGPGDRPASGFAFGGWTAASPSDKEVEVEGILDACEKCHNWALITIYQLSSDKFFSLVTISFLRWNMWLVVIMSTLLAVTGNGHGNPRPGDIRVRLATDMIFLGCTIVDKINMDATKFHSNGNRSKRQQSASIEQQGLGCSYVQSNWLQYVIGIMKLLGHCAVWYLLRITGFLDYSALGQLLFLLLSCSIVCLSLQRNWQIGRGFKSVINAILFPDHKQKPIGTQAISTAQ